MDEIILTSDKITKITGDDNSFPVFIKMFQYNDKWQHGIVNNEIKDEHGGDFNRNGSLGENFLEYSIDCRHESIDLENETEAFQEIINKLLHTKNPTFSKKYLLDKFYMFQIPDYGAQSMSAYYRDFVVHIYFKKTTEDGKEIKRKIWQKYIGIIKRFTQKIAYILIDKTAFTNEDMIYNFNNIEFNIIPKNGIETNFKNNELINEALDTEIFTYGNKEYGLKIAKNSDSTFANGSKIDFSKKISYYTINNKKEEQLKYSIELPNYFLNYIERDSIGNIVSSQAKDNEQDYFRQRFDRDYNNPNTTDFYNRKFANRVIDFSGILNNLRMPSFGAEQKDGSIIIASNILTRQNFADAYYCHTTYELVNLIFQVKIFTNGEKKFIFNFLPDYINIFDINGNKFELNSKNISTFLSNYNNNNDKSEYEVIINYSNKSNFSDIHPKEFSDKIDLSKDNLFLDGYKDFPNNNFFFKTNVFNEKNNNSEMIIDGILAYDNLVVFSDSRNYLNYLDNIDIYMIDRCFLIKLVQTKINSICSIYSLPDNFKNNINERRSIEQKIFVKSKNNVELNDSSLHFTSMMNLIYEENESTVEDIKLGNTKIVNFQDRNKNTEDIKNQINEEEYYKSLNNDSFIEMDL